MEIGFQQIVWQYKIWAHITFETRQFVGWQNYMYTLELSSEMRTKWIWIEWWEKKSSKPFYLNRWSSEGLVCFSAFASFYYLNSRNFQDHKTGMYKAHTESISNCIFLLRLQENKVNTNCSILNCNKTKIAKNFFEQSLNLSTQWHNRLVFSLYS